MTNKSARPLSVFLCHAKEDKPAVRDLYKMLAGEGIDVWLDEEKLLPGHDWRLEITKAVHEADIVLVCLSKKSINKVGFVQKEIKLALDLSDEQPEGTIFIIPARIEECTVPEQLQRWQWVDMFESNGYSKLKATLLLRAKSLGVSLYAESTPATLTGKVEIRGFGRVRVSINNKLVTIADWQTSEVRDLFFIFLENPQGLTKEEICVILWPEEGDLSRLKMRFKLAIYRLRHAIGGDIIIFSNQSYLLNNEYVLDYDVRSFEKYITQANSVDTVQERITLLKEAVDLVKGQFLADISGNWILPIRERLKAQYLTCLLALAGCYLEINQFQDAIETCQRAIRADRFFEEAYRLLMQVYSIKGNQPAIVLLYQDCKKTFQSELGISPSIETEDLYSKLIQ